MKKYVIGLDIGSSTTKVVVLDDLKDVVARRQVSASDPLESIFGGEEGLLHECGISQSDVKQLVLTGAGGSFLGENILGIPTRRVTEFEGAGAGARYLTGLEEFIVASIGTGTAIIRVDKAGARHVGGVALGGGTFTGLCKRLFGFTDIRRIEKMAEMGDLVRVDLGMNEITRTQISNLPDYATASNLGKMLDTATDEDVALGLLNMIYQNSATLAIFAARNCGYGDIVMTGSLSSLSVAKELLGRVGELYGVNLIVPENAGFVTALGAALIGLDD
ncbi:MAG: pantothenate kinase [Lachnospiraceae bacterium]|nr:pantothenate kinase [Lachnospiraceae bacterium]